MGLLDGKVAIVTGGGNGIGRAHSLALAAEGAKVVVNDLGSDRTGTGASTMFADKVVEEIKNMGGEAVASYDDISTIEGVDNLVWIALNAFGRIDILVNNAGILRDKTLLKMSEKEFDDVIKVHLKGTWLCSRAVARIMKIQKQGGRIINTTSVAGLLGNFGQTNYSSAKAGIYGFTRTASLELQRYGITVNAIAPIAYTRMTEDLPLFQALNKEEYAPENISPMVVFLASDLAADVTGRIFAVEGGKIYEFYMAQTKGVYKNVLQEGKWTPQEIKEKFEEITKKE